MNQKAQEANKIPNMGARKFSQIGGSLMIKSLLGTFGCLNMTEGSLGCLVNVYEICRHTHPTSQALANELSLRNNFMKQYLLTKEAMLNFFVFFHVKKNVHGPQ